MSTRDRVVCGAHYYVESAARIIGSPPKHPVGALHNNDTAKILPGEFSCLLQRLQWRSRGGPATLARCSHWFSPISTISSPVDIRRVRFITLGHSARHFCCWLNQTDVGVAQIDDGVIDRFARHKCRCPGERASDTLSTAFVGMIRKFVRFLEESQVVQPRCASDRRRTHPGLSGLAEAASRLVRAHNRSAPQAHESASAFARARPSCIRCGRSTQHYLVGVPAPQRGQYEEHRDSPAFLFAISGNSGTVLAIVGSGGANGGPPEAFESSQVSTRRQSRGFNQLVRYDDADRRSRSCDLVATGASWPASGRHYEAAHGRHRLAAGQPTRLRQGAPRSETPFAAGRRRCTTEVSDRGAA